jgi:uncharacterized protein DUF4342
MTEHMPAAAGLDGKRYTQEEIPMERTFWQKVEGTTDQILEQLRKLVDEGSLRRVVVKQRGRTVAEFPLTAGVIGAVIAPVAAAIGALTALLADCTIEVEKTVPDAAAAPPEGTDKTGTPGTS